jgi:NADPH:quinone reductase-like Zn-dependent oxidoreductase
MGAIGLSPLGVEAVASVEAIGAEVVGYALGDRVATRVPGGRPAFPRIVSERDLIGIPKDISNDDAAGFLRAGLVARTVVRQLHTIGRGDRVHIEQDTKGTDSFVAAWARHLGASVVDSLTKANVSVVASDFRTAEGWKFGHGLVQLAASDVFQAMRDGVFDEVPVSLRPLSDAASAHSEMESGRSRGPVVLVPNLQLAA